VISKALGFRGFQKIVEAFKHERIFQSASAFERTCERFFKAYNALKEIEAFFSMLVVLRMKL